MRKRAIAVGIAVGAFASTASAAAATQYWGGPMGGGDLPAANITYKVNDEGKVRDIQVQVRVKCRARGGGPAPNSRVITGWSRVKATETGFEGRRRNLFDGGHQKIEGMTGMSYSSGVFEARYRIGKRFDAKQRICHTGSQQWEAEPMTRAAWLRLRDYS